MESPMVPQDDTPARLSAYSDLDTSMVLEAAAGTGKTTTLTERVVNLIRRGAAEPCEIVAITFTKASATDLSLRIRERISTRLADVPPPGISAAEPLSPQERDRLFSASRRISEAHICTIHSFCSSILREYPIESGLDPRWRVMEDIEERSLFDEHWRNWLADNLGSEEPALMALFKERVNTGHLKALADGLYKQRDLFAFADPGSPTTLHWSDFLSCTQPEIEEAEEIGGRIERFLKDILDAPLEQEVNKGWLNDAPAQLHLRLDTLSRRDALGLPVIRPFMIKDTQAKAECGHAANALLIWEVLRAKLNKGRQLPAELEDSILRAHSTAEDLERYDQNRQNWLLLQLFLRLDSFFQDLKAAQSARGLLSQLDLLLQTKILLRDHPVIRQAFKKRFKAILIDETQDTDPLQSEIVLFLSESLRESVANSSDVQLEPAKLFIVGDPKQSIYRFRRADVELFEQTSNAICSADGNRSYLSKNFRSDGRIIEWVNEVFSEAMMPTDTTAYQARYVPLAIGGTPSDDLHLERDAAVTALQPPTAKHTPAVTEARHIAAWVKDLLSSDDSLSAGDIAILVRKGTHIKKLVHCLQAEGISAIAEGKGSFQKSTEFAAVALTLRALGDPTDHVALVACLRSFLFGVPDHEFLIHHAAGFTLDYTAQETHTPLPGAPILSRAFAILRRLHVLRAQTEPSDLLRMLFELTGTWQTTVGLDAIEGNLKASPRAQRLRRIMTMARSHRLGEHRGSFARLAAHMDSLIGEDSTMDDPPTIDEDAGAVRILTMHRSKGLEFKVVILAGMGDPTVSKDAELIVERPHRGSGASAKPGAFIQLGKSIQSKGWEAAIARDAARGQAEAIRLLYVACTRAEKSLVVSLYDDKGLMSGITLPASTHIDAADARIEAGDDLREMKDRLVRVLPSPGDILTAQQGDGDERSFEADDAQVEEWIQIQIAPMATESPARFRSPSSTLHASTAGEEGTATADERTPSSGGGARTGSALHRIMQTVLSVPSRGTALAPHDLDAVVSAEALSSGLTPKESRDLRSLAHKALSDALIGRARTSLACYTELPFCVPDHSGPGSALAEDTEHAMMIDGLIDLLFVEDDGLVIVDYKTDSVSGADIDARFAKYKSQGIDYAWAAHTATGLPIKEVSFLFVRSGVTRRVAADELRALGIPTEA